MPAGYSNKTGLPNKNNLGKHWKIKDTTKMKGCTNGFKKGCISWWRGKHLSEEHKEKVRLSQLGRKRGHQTEEHKRKISESNKGEKCYRYFKDRTLLKTDERLKSYDTKYKYWMLEVKKRDGWKCKINNEDCCGRLEAHHILDWINYPELRYDTNNGITLCLAHHPRKRAEEKRLAPIFQELVSVSN